LQPACSSSRPHVRMAGLRTTAGLRHVPSANVILPLSEQKYVVSSAALKLWQAGQRHCILTLTVQQVRQALTEQLVGMESLAAPATIAAYAKLRAVVLSLDFKRAAGSLCLVSCGGIREQEQHSGIQQGRCLTCIPTGAAHMPVLLFSICLVHSRQARLTVYLIHFLWRGPSQSRRVSSRVCNEKVMAGFDEIYCRTRWRSL